MRVGVVVLGDLGRSPRMGYHALSLANQGYQVELIGYAGSELPERIRTNENIRVKCIRQPNLPPIFPKLVAYLFKALLQSAYLLECLPVIAKLDTILVQTPPGIPSLPVLSVYSFLKGTRLVIDFHNYSHTILAMSCGPTHPLVKLTRILEELFGRTASAAFCVTKAMKADLAENWGIEANVLYDRPPDKFRPITQEEKHGLFERLSVDYPELGGREEGSTRFTKLEDGKATLRSDRPGLLVSSTSWTEDEDFSILLDALVTYEARKENEDLPELLCVITGKGELKEFYLNKISKLGLKNVRVLTPWLTAEDYPLMLAAADIGVSLHTSSSGLDLPMKVVDMFGCGLPVAAKGFPALGELVEDGKTGDIFETSEDLANIITSHFKGFPAKPSQKNEMYRDNLAGFRELGWEQNWSSTALPVFKAIRSSSPFPIAIFFLFLFLAFVSFLPTVQ